MSKKIIRNTILAVGAINLVLCIVFISSKINSNTTELTVIPETANVIPFIPDDNNLNNRETPPIEIVEAIESVEVIEDVKPVIFEGKTANEIKEKLSKVETPKVVITSGSIVDIVKNEKALKCHEFIKDETITEQGKFFKQQEC